MHNNISSIYDGHNLEIVEQFPYLGVLISRTGPFCKAKKSQVDKGSSAMYDIIRTGRLHKLSVKYLIDIFDKVLKPIFLYGCEIWVYVTVVILKVSV